MERLWIREVRRAARGATAPFGRQVALGCAAAAVGTVVASLLSLRFHGPAAQAAWAALWAVAGYVAIWSGIFIGHLLRYRSSGFRTTTGLRGTMTPTRAVLFSWSLFAGQAAARIPELTCSYASRATATGKSSITTKWCCCQTR